MIGIVLCVDADETRRGRLVRMVRASGATALETGDTTAALRLARGAQVVIGGGECGIATLARLSLDRPQLLRVVVVDPRIALVDLLQIHDRVHPWSLITDANDLPRLAALLHEAGAAAEAPVTEVTRRVQAARASFAALVADPLTGIDGYHYCSLRVEQEIERSTRYGRPLSLALVDVDHLQGVNDRHGRAAGDLALAEIAGLLQSGARSVDRVGRWAGGTFALLLPETAAGAALGIAERVRADLAARHFSKADEGRPAIGRLHLTVSCGIACTVIEGVSRPHSLVRRADQALWRAKRGGGNRSLVEGG